ncbi:hypothetical protein [Sandaracinus amylolyticus]|uniref:hypothetical protein n=1 Tax=Sandaracinus amylolyticus TaxID=927083 RepID=UPI001F2A8DA4|nr:hypothetical protein [Sandaracinus amylolyticus]UJR86534.1 Hypothetical protein I5071_86290 [Sandaracinus amylolyticus]
MRAIVAVSLVLALASSAVAQDVAPEETVAPEEDVAPEEAVVEEPTVGEATPPDPAPEPVVPAPQEPLNLGGGASLSPPPPRVEPLFEDRPLVVRGTRLLDQRWGDAADGRVEPLHAYASFAFFAGRVHGSDTFAIAPSMGLRLALTPELDVSASWVLAYGVASVRGEFDGGDAEPEPYQGDVERVETGNPTLTFSWAPRWESIALRVGLGFALPVAALAQAPTDAASAAQRDASSIVHDAMLGMYGGRDPWRFLPERIAFFVPARIAFGNDLVAGAVDVAGGFTLPVLGGSGDVEAVLQIAGDVAFAVVPDLLRAGLRGSIAAWGLGGESERYQPALEPWVRLALGPAFATVRATFALGGDLGFGSGDSELWAIHVGGGAALDRE